MSDSRILCLIEDQVLSRLALLDLLPKAGWHVTDRPDGATVTVLGLDNHAALPVSAAPIVGLAGDLGPNRMNALLTAGLRGLVSRRDEPAILLEALDKVAAGDLYLSRSMAHHAALQAVQPGPKRDFTAREKEVLDLLGQGQGLNEIAHRLGIGYRTVAQLAANIRRNLAIPHLFGLVKYAVENAPFGQIPP